MDHLQETHYSGTDRIVGTPSYYWSTQKDMLKPWHPTSIAHLLECVHINKDC